MFVLLVLACDARDASYRAADGTWSIEFPGTPSSVSSTIETVFGPTTMTVEAIDVGDHACFVAHYDVPERSEHSARQLLDAERDRGLRNTRATLVGERVVDLGGIECREIVADHAGGVQRVRVRNLLAGHRLFSLMFVGAKDESADAACARFFDSFVLR